MKKLASLLLILTMLLALFACGEKYPPVESTEKEATVMFTVTADGKNYAVRYELYRAFFLTYKSEIDGGDDTVWSGPDKAEYVERINEIIIPKIANIYATIRLAEKIGVDFSSKEVKSTVDEFITASIEGGIYEGGIIEGLGSYEEYLEHLKSLGLNYSVQVLLYHYAIAESKINEYYVGTLNNDNFTPDATVGALEYTEEDVREFYESDECVRVLRAFVQRILGEERAAQVREAMYQATGETQVGLVIMQNTTASAEDGFGGMTVGRYSLDVTNYKEFTDVAFSLPVGSVSGVLEISTGVDNGYHILYRAEKSDEHFEEYYASVVIAYLDNEIGKMINDITKDIIESINYSAAYYGLNHAEISMEQ